MRAGRWSWCRRCQGSPIDCLALRHSRDPATSKARARACRICARGTSRCRKSSRIQSLRQPVVDALNREFDELERVVTALAVLQEVSPRWLDALAATGEILSSQIVAAALTSHKLLATYVDSRKAVVTDGEHTAAAPMFEETTAALMTHAPIRRWRLDGFR